MKAKRIMFQASEEEKKKIEAKAKALALSVSAYVRMAALNYKGDKK